MANVYSYQVLKDTTEHAVIKLTAKFDGTGQEANVSRIQANSLYGAMNTTNQLLTGGGTAKSYYGLSLYRLWYDTTSAATGDVEVFWNATPPANSTIFMLNGNGEYDGNGNWVTISNNTRGQTGSNGDIGVNTRGMVANDSYTIIAELRKDNADYQRGQFNDPAAFNYGSYGMKP
jgi:hypothetical protein